MPVRHFLSIADHSADELREILAVAAALKARFKAGIPDRPLAGRTLALLFEKPSLRTRVSFEVGMFQLGGHALSLDHNEVGLGRRESVKDAARVLGSMVDGLMIRTFSQARVVELAAHAGVPVINGLSDSDHPCQAMADLLTLQEHHGRLDGLRVAYVGDSNNVARSLGEACGKLGVGFVCGSPSGFSFPPAEQDRLRSLAAPAGAVMGFTHDPLAAVAGADAVYTDTWVSMGQEGETENKLRAFDGFQVNAALMKAAKPGAVVMHCLPAHRGQEITDEVLDGPAGITTAQASNRLHAQKALLRLLLAPAGR